MSRDTNVRFEMNRATTNNSFYSHR